MKTLKLTILIAISMLLNNDLIAQKKIDSLLLKLHKVIDKENIPGAMISIVQSDSILYEGGIGYANIEKEEAVTEKHLFRLGSISKSITALGIVKLVSDDKVKLNSTLDEIDSNLNISNPWKKVAPISIEKILEHTAGFDDMHSHAIYNFEDVSTPSCLSMINSHKKSLYARWKPGVRMAYSNPGYVLAGHLIEEISNKPYYQYLAEEILLPVGMNNSGFHFKNKPELLMTQGYKREGGKILPVEFSSVQGGSASDFCSNAEDMSLFLMFMLSRKTKAKNTIIKPELFDRIENPKTTVASRNGFTGGYGLGNMSLWSNNYLFHGHDGGIDGFSSMYLYSQEANFGFAISVNKKGNIWSIIDEILLFYLGENKYYNGEIKPVSDDIKNKFSGFYNFKNPRNETMFFVEKLMSGHSIEFSGDTLLVKDFGGVIRDSLIHKGNNQFYRINENVPFVALIESENKTPILWLGSDYFEKGNKPFRLAKNYLLFVCLFMTIMNFIVGFFWWIIQLIRKKSSIKSPVSLWISSLSFITVIVSFLFTTELYAHSERINIGSMILFLSTISFFFSALYSLFKALKIKNKGKLFTWYFRIVAFSLSIVALWFLFNNLIGFKLWSY